jgi:hypothetical protein
MALNKDTFRQRRTYSFYRARPRASADGSFRDLNVVRKTYAYYPQAPRVPAGPGCDLFYHDTTFSPVLLCQFNDTLADTSGNGLNLVVDAGTVNSGSYVNVVSGDACLRGLSFDGATRLKHASDPRLQITGDITVEFILVLKETPQPESTVAPIVTYTGGVDDTSSTVNYLWHTYVDDALLPAWFSEHGVGVNDSFIGTAPVRGVDQLQHFAVTRTSNVIRFYSNGVQVGAASSALTTPTDGSASLLFVGGTGGTGSTERFYTRFYMSSLKVIASALTAAQVKSEYNRTLGGRLGRIT